MATRAIADYGLIGGGDSAALVDRSGSLAWLCWPRFDSQAIFASLVGDDDNGIWTIKPVGTFQSSRRYRPDTLMLETQFKTESGAALLCDFMPYQEKSQAVIRTIRCVAGTVDMKMVFAPRFACGKARPRYERRDAKLLVGGDNLSLALQSKRPDLLRADETVEFKLSTGQEISFVLTESDSAPSALESYTRDAAARCERFWRQWSSRCTYNGPWRDAVVRSLITLKALIHAPSGGIVAAPTTSLPENMGGHRNWDYRYCWLRDSTFTVLALLHAGYPEEAEAWVKWLVRAISPNTHRTKTFYGVIPHTEIDELEASWLCGFNGSRPVRFGNGARDQVQLGIYGEVQDTLHQWRMSVQKPEKSAWQDQCDMLHRLISLVGKPDAGIWEQRGHLEMFTQSQALAWVGFDRAIKSAERFDFAIPGDWRPTRANLHDTICAKGFDRDLGSFTRAYGSRSFDASCLLLAMVGFLPANDVRIRGTVHAIRRHLSAGPFVYRYDASRENDGVGGAEGAFLPCSFWLADNLILQRHEDAGASIFEAMLGAGNDLGLYSEEYDVSGKTLLGNFPQALTHLSLVHTALNLTGSGPVHSRSKAAY
jgi:GH15 family glucan-1,4-alpha-glucosidase